MKVGFIGLGRMGANLLLNLHDHGHEAVVYNRTYEKTKEFAEGKEGFTPAETIQDMIEKLPEGKKVVWLMITAGQATDDAIEECSKYLSEGDIIIDGGNSYFEESIKRGKELEEKGITFLDCGTSGGVSGARNGACMMIGGDKDAYEYCEKLFSDSCVEGGSGYMGTSGAGHYVKMVHNAIEYGMMGAIAEGLDVVREKGKEFGTDLDTVANVYSNGSIISSSLVNWVRDGMKADYFEGIKGDVPRGETEGEMESLMKMFPMEILEAAVNQRRGTRGNPSFRGKLVSTMRYEFGGHKFKEHENEKEE